MADLGRAENTIALLPRHSEFRFQKKFGQNFLIDSHVLDRIAAAAELTEEDAVLEIGPGIGTLTQHLAERAGKVLAVEIDRALIPILEESLADYDNVEILQGDILEQNLDELAEKLGGRPIKVVANLPYYITTPILMTLLESKLPIVSITVMVQREVAERMQASPGGKDYGSLSLAVQYYAAAEIVANVPPHCFLPRPKVGSAVICLKKYREKPVQAENETLLFRIIRASFNQRRKTLVNGLKNAGFAKDKITAALQALELPETVRGETLSLAQFAALSAALQA